MTAEKKGRKYTTFVDKDGRSALVMPEDLDPAYREEVKTMFESVRDGLLDVIDKEMKRRPKEGRLIVENKDKHKYSVVLDKKTKEYIGTCNDFPSLKWMARTKSDSLAGIKCIVRDIEHVLRAREIDRIADDRRQELELARRKKAVAALKAAMKKLPKKKLSMEEVVEDVKELRHESYSEAKDRYLSSPPHVLKGRKGKYPNREEVHDRGKAPRKRITAAEAMELAERDRLERDMRLVGIGVFGTSDLLDEWLDSNIMALNWKTPKSLLGTSEGIEEVINLLFRIEHGIIS